LQYFFQHYSLAKVERPFEQLEAS